MTDKEGFLEVDGVSYNNFEDALVAAGTEGTIKVIKDVTDEECYKNFQMAKDMPKQLVMKNNK